jgi:hypothetical protein
VISNFRCKPVMPRSVLLLLLTASAWAQITTPKMGDFPPLRVQALVGTREHATGHTGYHKEMEITPKLIVEGASTMTSIPAAEAIMVVISMDTRAKYVEHREVCNVASSETVQLPAVPNGSRREFNFAELSLKFDGDRDSSNVGGEVYKTFICGIRDPTTRSLIYFYTPDVQMANFCKAHPEKRDELLSMQKGSNFPMTLK